MIDAVLAPHAKRAAATSRSHRAALARFLLDQCHPAQQNFVRDPAKWLALLTSRGAGKTIALAVRFLRTMSEAADRACFYFATTRKQAKRLLWKPLKAMNKRFRLGATFNESELLMTLPNGSWLILCSADKIADLEQYRGLTYHGAGIDEAASYSDALLEYLLDEILGARNVGWLALVGTPGKILRGLFYEVTRDGSTLARAYGEPANDNATAWSYHTWSTEYAARYVPAIAEIYATQLETIKAKGWSEDHPVRRREYGGKWAADDTENVYAYQAHKDGEPWNQWDPAMQPIDLAALVGIDGAKEMGPAVLPAGHDWRYSVGLDLGHGDDLAIEVTAFADSYPYRLHCYEFVARKMTVSQLARVLLGLEAGAADFDRSHPGGLLGTLGEPDAWAGDSSHLGGMIFDELRKEYGLDIQAAKRADKHDAIELYNGDLIDGRKKILKGSRLEEQLASLQWEEKADGGLQEAKRQANHSTDADLYGDRQAARLHQYKPAKQAPDMSSVDAQEAASLQRLRDAKRSAEGGMHGFIEGELYDESPGLEPQETSWW